MAAMQHSKVNEEGALVVTKIERVYLDLDGVLADFDRGWRERLSHNPELAKRIEKYDAKFAGQQRPWRFWEHLNLKDDAFWGMVGDEGFWANLPWTADGRHILEGVAGAIHFGNVYLLTHPPRSAGAYAGKFLWVQRHLPDLLGRLILAGRKYLLARPESLLIDDGDDNVIDFANHGGRTVQIPREWNRLHHLVNSYKQLQPRGWLRASGIIAA